MCKTLQEEAMSPRSVQKFFANLCKLLANSDFQASAVIEEGYLSLTLHAGDQLVCVNSFTKGGQHENN